MTDDFAPPPPKPSLSTNLLLCLVVLLPLGIQLYLSLHDVKGSWDDGAITAAFARTWAQSGRIALTPGSPIVEGYSSLAWFLLLSVPYFFTHNMDAGLIWMKLLSAAFMVLSLRMMYLVAMRQFQDRAAAAVSTILLAYLTTVLNEIGTGMEMGLATFLMLLLFYVVTSRSPQVRVAGGCAVGFLILTARFESPFMLLFLLLGLLYAAYRKEPEAMPLREILIVAAFLIVSFALLDLWRYRIFGEWMPNTIYAKRWFPYRDWTTPQKAILARYWAMKEVLRIFGFPLATALLVFAWAALRGKLSLHRLRAIHPAIFSLALSCFAFGAVFGNNWGYEGRMVSAMLPFLLLTTVALCFSALPGRRSLTQAFAVLLFFHGAIWVRSLVHPSVNVSTRTIEAIGIGADSIRQQLQQPNLTIMISDVGGSSLCCSHLAVLDSGLLSNPELARSGWDGFAAYFRKTQPDVVETHAPWAGEAHIYDSGLLDGYSIVAANGIRFFVRNDLYRKLLQAKAGTILPLDQAPACIPSYPADAAFSRSRRTCLVLGDPATQKNL